MKLANPVLVGVVRFAFALVTSAAYAGFLYLALAYLVANHLVYRLPRFACFAALLIPPRLGEPPVTSDTFKNGLAHDCLPKEVNFAILAEVP